MAGPFPRLWGRLERLCCIAWAMRAQAEFVPVRIVKLAGQRSAADDAAGCWRYLLEWRRADVGSPAVQPCHPAIAPG